MTSQQTLSIVTTLQAKQAKLRMKREMYLLKSTAATVIAVVISWLPFAIVVLFFATTAPAQLKRVRTRLFMSSKSHVIPSGEKASRFTGSHMFILRYDDSRTTDNDGKIKTD